MKNFKKLRDELTQKLFKIFNEKAFDNQVTHMTSFYDGNVHQHLSLVAAAQRNADQVECPTHEDGRILCAQEVTLY